MSATTSIGRSMPLLIGLLIASHPAISSSDNGTLTVGVTATECFPPSGSGIWTEKGLWPFLWVP